MRRPTRQEMALEHQARSRARRAARLKEASALAAVRTGSLESIFGRILLPGEQPGLPLLDSQDSLFGSGASQPLTRPWDMKGE